MTDKTGKHPLRQAYDAAERLVEPPLKSLAQSSGTHEALAVVGQVRRLIGRRFDAVTGGVVHLANLPTRADVLRLRTQIGALDREVRRLRVQLELEREEHGRRGAPDERD